MPIEDAENPNKFFFQAVWLHESGTFYPALFDDPSFNSGDSAADWERYALIIDDFDASNKWHHYTLVLDGESSTCNAFRTSGLIIQAAISSSSLLETGANKE